MHLPVKSSVDQILLQLIPTATSRKVLFWGEGIGEISSYVAGWMASEGIDVIVLDGANRFDPYMVSSFARKVLVSPENLLKKIRISRAFTCYQMVTLVGERLISLVGAIHACTPKCGVSARRHESPLQKPWVILLGPITTFLDEDVPDREVRPLFERVLRKIEEMAMEGVSFLLFQPFISFENRSGKEMDRKPPFTRRGWGEFIDSRRAYVARRLFQISDAVWKICLEEEGPKLVLEKGLTERSTKFQIPIIK